MKQIHDPSGWEYLAKYGAEIKGMIYGAFLFLNIDTDVVKILLCLMLFDTVLGLAKSIRLNIRVSLKILIFGVVTKALVLLIPMTLALMGKALKMGDFTPLVDVVLRVVVVAEGISIFTNFYSIRIRKPVENVDVITMLLSSIRKGLLRLVRSFLVKIETPAGVVNEVEPENNNEDEL